MNICFEKDGGIICSYDIMSTKEKQATPKAAFVFLVPLENEQPAEAGGRARQRGLVIEGEKRERGQPGCSSQRAKPVADNRFILTCWFDLVISFILLMFLVQFYTRFQACTQFFTRRKNGRHTKNGICAGVSAKGGRVGISLPVSDSDGGGQFFILL